MTHLSSSPPQDERASLTAGTTGFPPATCHSASSDASSLRARAFIPCPDGLFCVLRSDTSASSASVARSSLSSFLIIWRLFPIPDRVRERGCAGGTSGMVVSFLQLWIRGRRDEPGCMKIVRKRGVAVYADS